MNFDWDLDSDKSKSGTEVENRIAKFKATWKARMKSVFPTFKLSKTSKVAKRLKRLWRKRPQGSLTATLKVLDSFPVDAKEVVFLQFTHHVSERKQKNMLEILQEAFIKRCPGCSVVLLQPGFKLTRKSEVDLTHNADLDERVEKEEEDEN